MRNRAITRAAIAACALAAAAAAPASADPLQGGSGGNVTPPAKESYIVEFAPGISNSGEKTKELGSSHGFKASHVYEHALEGFAAELSAGQAEALRRNPNVKSIVKDHLPVGPTGTVASTRAGETQPTGIRRLRFGGSIVPTVTTQSVAVLDTGVDLDHPDLNVVSGKDCTAPTTTADDDHGHGTHVAGTIAARNNGSGVIGVVPDTRIVAVKVLHANRADNKWSEVICGVDWVRANASSFGIRVINMSLGGGYDDYRDVDDERCGARARDEMDTLHGAICNLVAANVNVVAAAGNDGKDMEGQAPAAFNEIITVSAMADTNGTNGGGGTPMWCAGKQSDDSRATFSNYATTAVDSWHLVAAPGACILSTRIGGGTTTMSGTSMAAPHVAGIVAYCLESFPGWFGARCSGTPANVRYDLWNYAAERPASYGFTGDPRSPIAGKQYSYLVAGM